MRHSNVVILTICERDEVSKDTATAMAPHVFPDQCDQHSSRAWLLDDMMGVCSSDFASLPQAQPAMLPKQSVSLAAGQRWITR